MNQAIKTDKIFKETELDKGFILRANDEIARTLRELIRGTHNDKESSNLEILYLDPNKRTYG